MRMLAPEGFSLGSLGLLATGPRGTTCVLERGGETFVCKRLSTRMLGSDDAVAAAHAEAQILGAIDGRGAPKLVASGDDADGPYLVMEHVALRALATFIETGGLAATPAGITWLARAARSAFEALAEVHEARDADGPLDVVHADLSPHNVLVSHDATRAKIVDFGLARARVAPAPSGEMFRGTLLYAAPEVARGEAFDARADVFSLAASLLHALSGVPPRRAEEVGPLLVEAGEVPVDAWAAAAASCLPDELARTIARCVAFEPGARPVARAAVRGT